MMSSVVEEPRMPSFFSSRPTAKPGKLFSTMKALMPRWPFVLSVTAKMTKVSATPPLVIKTLLPLRM